MSTELAAAPLYREVKAALVAGLAAREWAPGEALPSEARLAERFGVSIGTIRKAVDELVAERVLVRQQGRGTFVATHGPRRLLFHFFHIVRDDGEKELPEPELLAFERGRADAAEAARLAIGAGDRVLRFRNLLRLGGEPVVLDAIVLPQALFPDLTAKVLREREETIYALYQTRYGIDVVRTVERLKAALADRAAARVLGLGTGAPLLRIDRTALTYHDRPVELRTSLVNTAHHGYLADFGKSGA
ncbi:MAG: GntR family transcriptional regulator [Burkholderiales bacterium]|nr:GntR family transcriptional regulator [Burkholderiales bacterium]